MATFAMAIANIAVRVLRARNVTLVTSVSIPANTPRLLGLRVHEAGTLSRADLALTHPRTRHTAVLAKEALLALALSLSQTALLHAAASFDTATNSTQGIPCTLHGTVAATKALAAAALATLGPRRDALSLPRADTTFAILRTGHSTLATQVTLLALAEGDFLHLVVKARPVASADFVLP